MGTEIERKFLCHEGAWRAAPSLLYRQGYLSDVPERTVRVRTAGDKAYLTIKGVSVGASRLEFEYDIPTPHANQLLDQLCLHPLIEKRRFTVEYEGKEWVVDEFLGENAGLIVAEIELDDEGEAFARPAWVGAEVTSDTRFYNANLITNPYSAWKNKF